MTRCRKNIVPGSRAAIFRLASSFALICVLTSGLTAQSIAQLSTFQGTLVDADTGVPLQDAHVFIASSLLGTVTDRNGQFLLKNVPPGAHRLYASMVGYESSTQDTLVRANHVYELTIRLQSTAVPLEEVVVNARKARRWQRRLIKFQRLFLGETENSKLTTIVNPEVLSFKSRFGNLSATASAPLIIENRALGYRIHYYLKEFDHYGNTIKYDGEPSYQELVPADSIEAALWEEERGRTFFGSQRHFFLSLIAGRTKEEGFEIWRRYSLESNSGRFGVNPSSLLEPGPTPLEHMLTFNGVLEIVYTGEHEDEAFRRWQRMADWRRPGPQRSFMELNHGPTLVDQTGEVIDPYGIVVYGYYAFERIADQCPKEYRPVAWMDR